MSSQSIIKPGRWQTKDGSILEFDINSEGLITGFYQTVKGQPSSDEKFPVTGFVNGDLIGLTCSWGEYHSVTSWCGRYINENGRDTIHYMWHLAREYEDVDNKVKADITFTFHTMSGVFYYVDS